MRPTRTREEKMKQPAEQTNAAPSKEYYEGYRECSIKIEEAVVAQMEMMSDILYEEEAFNILHFAKTDKFLKLIEKRNKIKSKIEALRKVEDLCDKAWRFSIREQSKLRNI